MGYGDVTPQNGNFNTARRNSTTLSADYDIDIGYFTPTSEGDSTEFGNSTPGDDDSVLFIPLINPAQGSMSMVLKVFEMGSIKTLIVWENLDISRVSVVLVSNFVAATGVVDVGVLVACLGDIPPERYMIKLRIGVSVKEGFNEFVKVENNSGSHSGYKVTGYCIDVFKAALDELPYDVPYDLIPFQDSTGKAGSYDDLVYQVNAQNYDAAVGDMTITASRSELVDFTLPYAEGGVSMVVLVKKDMSKDTWIYLKPLEWKLWVTTGTFFFIIGAVVWILEHRVNREFRGGPHPLYQWGTMLSFSFSALVFAQKERVLSSLGRFVIAIWLFVVLIITQSYTANLTSMLTIQRSDPTYTDVNELKDGRYNVGYQEGSFVFGMLKQMDFHESNLIIFKSPKEFDDAFSNGTIVAAFEELPYIELLLAEYCGKYMMVGEIHQNDGLGFVSLFFSFQQFL
ncbi:glutamate receptor 2.9-like [Papaver somniferum]|nr:glutamate receptor 2.9-like [Papaver somniferum]XP_026411144.1 glutamate receptor 2.9-like [Papaver somniferum]